MHKIRKLKNLRYSHEETLVRDATSNSTSLPTRTLLNEIALLSYNSKSIFLILQQAYKRATDYNVWRHVWKSIMLLRYLAENGSEEIALSINENSEKIRDLLDYNYVDNDGVDQGRNVRFQASQLFEILSDFEKLAKIRNTIQKQRDALLAKSMQRQEMIEVPMSEEELKLALKASRAQLEIEKKNHHLIQKKAEEEFNTAIRLSKLSEEELEALRRRDREELERALKLSMMEDMGSHNELAENSRRLSLTSIDLKNIKFEDIDLESDEIYELESTLTECPAPSNLSIISSFVSDFQLKLTPEDNQEFQVLKNECDYEREGKEVTQYLNQLKDKALMVTGLPSQNFDSSHQIDVADSRNENGGTRTYELLQQVKVNQKKEFQEKISGQKEISPKGRQQQRYVDKQSIKLQNEKIELREELQQKSPTIQQETLPKRRQQQQNVEKQIHQENISWQENIKENMPDETHSKQSNEPLLKPRDQQEMNHQIQPTVNKLEASIIKNESTPNERSYKEKNIDLLKDLTKLIQLLNSTYDLLKTLQLNRDQGSISKYVSASRDIQDLANQIVTSWKPIANKCSDTILAKNVVESLIKLDVLGRQLQVVTNRQEISNLNDYSGQVLTCAFNVVQSAIHTLKDCEAAKVRFRQDVEDVLLI